MHMYLVRKLDGKPYQTYKIDPETRTTGRWALREPTVWKFTPFSGGEKYRELKRPSRLCGTGIAAIADTEMEAKNMIEAFRRTGIFEPLPFFLKKQAS